MRLTPWPQKLAKMTGCHRRRRNERHRVLAPAHCLIVDLCDRATWLGSRNETMDRLDISGAMDGVSRLDAPASPRSCPSLRARVLGV
jgi:hypothetical protein